MAHFKRKRPRTKGAHGKDYKALAREFGGFENLHGFYAKCPGYWNRLYHIRPLRRHNAELEKKVLMGHDPDDLSWPVGSRKPHIYYW